MGREIAIDRPWLFIVCRTARGKKKEISSKALGNDDDDVDDDEWPWTRVCSCFSLHSEYAPRALTIDTLVLAATRHLQAHAKHSPRVLGRDDAVIP